MLLSKITINNFRLIVNAELDVHENITLIVGRNNTAKTSCMRILEKVVKGDPLSYDDYPLQRRKYAFILLAQFMRKKITYDQLCKRLPLTSIEFLIDYSLDDAEDDLGALSPFIIEVDVDTTTALIKAEYALKLDEESLRKCFDACFFKNGTFSLNPQETKEVCSANFSKLFELVIYAINPKNKTEIQTKTQKELANLFPFYPIPAERILGEATEKKYNSLTPLISNYFSVDIKNLDPKIAEEVLKLRETVAEANQSLQRKSSDLLSSIVKAAIDFGYPNGEELQLGVNTKLQIDNQIKDQTELTYTAPLAGESLPSSHNGLGYKNLIKIEFLLAGFAENIRQGHTACIPLLFIEEPESHMHPQMQHTFGKYLQTFLSKISTVHIQTFLTSHSAHIANTIDFSNIRYAQKTKKGVVYKDLGAFCTKDPENITFIKKYLTLTRCDLFFADKVILVEGDSERLLIPDMIEKCDKAGLFAPIQYKLPSQYYTLIEIGGTYAYKFIPFIRFLGIPCLIITDIDAVKDNCKAFVSEGETTSNPTINRWFKHVKKIPSNDKTRIKLEDIINLTDDEKTMDKCHIEFQVPENGLCGRSLEEAIKNVNRSFYNLVDPVTEKKLEFSSPSKKPDFALNLIFNCPDYSIPKYIKDGLIWLNKQKVLV